MKLRYVMAQVLLIGLWGLDWYRYGASNKPSEAPIFGSLLWVTFFAGIPALGIGLIDGFAGAREERFLKNLILSVLVIALTLWIVLFGVTSIYMEDLFGQTGHPPSVASRMGGLVAMEAIFWLEFGIAYLLQRIRSR